ncbi:hypothetical protein QX776_18605 [Alteromonadaceae bacterium BrNp21-10]|nr:hypothetical protein [Alteromonadaceae bacterium BrNp21-10]
MKTMTYNNFFQHSLKQFKYLLLVVLAFYCFPALSNNFAPSVVSKLSSTQIVRGLDFKAHKPTGLSKLESGKFIGYSHKIGNNNVLDFSLNTYVYTDESNDALEWVIGVEHELLVVNFCNNQATNNKYIEVMSRYPLNNEISINGYMSNNNDGYLTRQDYAVAVTYSHANTLEIAAGYSDRETHAQLTDGNLFVNVVGRF